MTVLDWVKIIIKILELIAGGMSKENAVLKTAAIFGISKKAIWKHGGF